MRIMVVIASLVIAISSSASLAAGPPVPGRSPLSVFSPAAVFIPTAPNFFTQKRVQSRVLGQDTVIGGVLVPTGATARQADYVSICLPPDCINLGVLTPQQNTQIHDQILNRGFEVSRLDPQNYLSQRNSAQRQVWRWSSFGDGLPFTTAVADQFRAGGVSIIPTLAADNPVYRDPAFPVGRSCMTTNFQSVFNPAFGYSASYFDLVTRLVTAYSDIMPIIVIENEVDQVANTWCEPLGVRDGYRKMVITAKYAIRQAGASVLVADSGMMGGSWIRMALVDLVAERTAIVNLGQTPSAVLEQQILELISQVQIAIPLTLAGNVDWLAIENAAAGPDSPSVQNAREVIRLLNAAVIDPDLGEPALDVYNFHYHQTSSAMPAVAQYIRRAFDTNGAPLREDQQRAGQSQPHLPARLHRVFASLELLPHR